MILRKNKKAIPCPFCESTIIMESVTRENRVTAVTCGTCLNDVTLKYMSHIKSKSTYERVNQISSFNLLPAFDIPPIKNNKVKQLSLKKIKNERDK